MVPGVPRPIWFSLARLPTETAREFFSESFSKRNGFNFLFPVSRTCSMPRQDFFVPYHLPSRVIGTLRITRRQRQRERHKTKGLMSKTIDVHVHYNFWYISLPSSAKQQREMTKFSVVWRTQPQPLIFHISIWN